MLLMFLISIYHLDFGTSVAMEHNGKGLGEGGEKKDGNSN
jgi:hypothetical protein